MNEYGMFLENGDLLEEVELDLPIDEAFLFNLPSELKKLKTELKEEFKAFSKEDSNKLKELNKDKKFVNKLGNNFSYARNADQRVADFIDKTIKKFNITVYGHSVYKETTYVNGVPMYVTINHNITAMYKDYVIKMKLTHTEHATDVRVSQFYVAYDKDSCSIPKSVVADALKTFDGKIENVSSSSKSIKLTPKSKGYVKYVLPKLENKYGDTYEVKKNFGGFSITIKEKK